MSQAQMERALSALSPAASVFRLAVAGAVEVVQGVLPRGREERDLRTLAELGAAAQGEEETGLPGAFPLPREQGAALGRIRQLLGELLQEGDRALVVRVPTGGDLLAAVEEAQARIGRVFGAAQVLGHLQQGSYREELHAPLLERYPWRLWNRAERQIAPPLVIEVDGEDCHVSGLAERLDGTQKFVLLVGGERCPPAPLARLITPGIFVQQTASEVELERLARVRGPAIAALLPERAARFVHDPRGGPTLAERLSVSFLDTPEIGGAMGGVSAFRMAEDLAHLRLLAAVAAGGSPLPPPVPGPGPERGGPRGEVGSEAALEQWLLDQARSRRERETPEERARDAE